MTKKYDEYKKAVAEEKKGTPNFDNVYGNDTPLDILSEYESYCIIMYNKIFYKLFIMNLPFLILQVLHSKLLLIRW